jgi:hypothetical protein
MEEISKLTLLDKNNYADAKSDSGDSHFNAILAKISLVQLFDSSAPCMTVACMTVRSHKVIALLSADTTCT